MASIHLLLGTNLGDRFKNIDLAHTFLEEKIGITVKASRIYRSVPWGFQAEQDFLNQVVCIETVLEPIAVMHEILLFEEQHGRIREQKGGVKIYHSRTIDIDILLWGNRILNTEFLVVPHPRLTERRFVLLPLAEVSPAEIHPVLNLTMRELCYTCTDESRVEPV